jgi:hypothetical protein
MESAISGRILQYFQQGQFFKRGHQYIEPKFRLDHNRGARAEYSVGPASEVLNEKSHAKPLRRKRVVEEKTV